MTKKCVKIGIKTRKQINNCIVCYLSTSGCYPCSGPTVNPIALSTRWLAYADKRVTQFTAD
jgi:hypothetical protein